MIGAPALAALVWLAAFATASANAPQAASAAIAGAEAFRCPMHPDVIGPPGSRCSRCGMVLVPAGTSYVPYLLDVETQPRALSAQEQGRMRLSVRHPDTHALVRRFEVVHERVFHLFLVSRDLEYFAHVHPELGPDGSLYVPIDLPRPGPYQMVGDFVPEGGPPQLIQRSLVTAGYRGALAMPPLLREDLAAKVINGTRIELTPPDARARREQLVTLELADAESGVPVHDLQPFLGASGHLFVANADLSVVFHSHPAVPVSSVSGPAVVYQILFPRPGMYRMWAQFQRHGQVLTAPFTVAIVEP